MKYFFFKLICLVSIYSSCKKEEPSPSFSNPNHLTFFGFVLIDTFWDDPTDNDIKTNYKDEVSPFSNMADILVINPQDNIIERMTAMRDLQMKCILHLHEIFFESVGTAGPSGNQYDLRIDYKERWNAFVSSNQLQSNQNLVQAFYIGEEPTWNSISFSELSQATDYVKATFPTIPILIIEASPALSQLQIPNSVDWVGFDHYFIKNPTTNALFQQELRLLKSKMNDTQHILIIMDTHYIPSVHGQLGDISLNEMEDVANNYYTLAKNEPKAIGMLGYFWPSGFDSNTSIGARNMPQHVKNAYIRIGKAITNK